jgi:hypothetical protein
MNDCRGGLRDPRRDQHELGDLVTVVESKCVGRVGWPVLECDIGRGSEGHLTLLLDCLWGQRSAAPDQKEFEGRAQPTAR